MEDGVPITESLASKEDSASNDAGYFQWIFDVEDHQRILEHMANMLARRPPVTRPRGARRVAVRNARAGM
jgi:hypothetical protein